MRLTKVYDTYWRFAAERQAIYLRRLEGGTGPWTNDEILGAHRFTNAYRAADRVSQFLISEVQGRHDRPQAEDEVFFRTMLFKLFNKIPTWERLEAELGTLSWQSANLDGIAGLLDLILARGSRLYSAAYIMPSPAFGHARKHRNHLALLWRMMEDGAPSKVTAASSLEEVYTILRAYQGLGPFLAFQFAIDLNYSAILEHEERGFVVAGPGALDGITKCFSDFGGKTPEQIIHWVCDRQDIEFASRGIDFPGLFGRPLQPIDCQNLFCEISKYARVAHPDVTGLSGRTRIKQRFRASTQTLPAPVFPPRWGLNVPQRLCEARMTAALL